MNPTVELFARVTHLYTCEEMCDLATEEQEHALGTRRRLWVRAHLALCPGCRRFRRQLALTQETVRLAAEQEHKEKPDPETATRELKKALAERLKQRAKEKL